MTAPKTLYEDVLNVLKWISRSTGTSGATRALPLWAINKTKFKFKFKFSLSRNLRNNGRQKHRSWEEYLINFFEREGVLEKEKLSNKTCSADGVGHFGVHHDPPAPQGRPQLHRDFPYEASEWINKHETAFSI